MGGGGEGGGACWSATCAPRERSQRPLLPWDSCKPLPARRDAPGFTKLLKEEYIALKAKGQLVKDGVTVKVAPLKGPLGPKELEKLPLSMLGDDDDAEDDE